MLRYRLMTGSTLVAVLAVIVFVDHPLAELLMVTLGALALVGALREYCTMAEAMGWRPFRGIMLTASLALLACALPIVQARVDAWALAVLIVTGFLLACFGRVLRCREAAGFRTEMQGFAASAGGLIYLGMTLLFLVLIFYLADEGYRGSYLLFFLVLTTKCGDIGGFTVGSITAKRARGNHKMVPFLSPKKSWEGYAGSLLFSGVAGWALYRWLGGEFVVNGQVVLNDLTAVVAGLLLASVGLLGDLAASAMKRASGLKDSGRGLPGMGGVLDVLDSLVFAAPLFYCYVRFMSA